MGRKRSWEQESISFGDILNLSRRMLSFAKEARDLGEAAGVSRGTLRGLASMLLDIEDGVKAQTGTGLTERLQDYLGTLIPQAAGEKPAAEEVSDVDRRIAEVNAKLTQLYGAGWFRDSDKVGVVFRVWEKLVAAGYALPRDQFDQNSEYFQLIDDFRSRVGNLQPSAQSVENLANMVEPMVERAQELVRVYGRAELPDTGFSSQVRADPNYIKVLLEAVANRRPHPW
jgi:hypothetical protein